MILKLNFDGIFSDADALIIIPPFDDLKWPVLGVHLLQACAKEKGYHVKVFYANLALAAVIGEETYQKISDRRFWGEALFSQIAYNNTPFYKNNSLLEHFQSEMVDANLTKKDFIKFEKVIAEFVDEVVAKILKYHFKIVGCSTTFGHIAGGIGFLNRIKTLFPSVITVIGGAYCCGDLNQGLASLSDKIDYIFSGDSEQSFPSFIEAVAADRLPAEKIIMGERPDLEANPVPDYDDYFEQSHSFLPGSGREISITYETSRGCWWGQKSRCNFCGLSFDLNYQFKSARKVIEDLKYLTQKYPQYRVGMADCILPYDYFHSLLPLLPKELPGVKLFYEVKANLKLEQVILLKTAGIDRIQPGIESLSSSLLKKMNKGCLARHNVTLLRYCRSAEILIYWNFLFGVPNETLEEYEAMLEFLPLIKHFYPPVTSSSIALMRYSQYFDRADQFGITKISPESIYNFLLPERAEIDQFAFYFDSQYEHCFTNNHVNHNPIVNEFLNQIKDWKRVWEDQKTIPKLKLTRIPGNKYLLIDSRGLGNPLTQYISEQQALAILLDWPMRTAYQAHEEIRWALEHRLIIELDSWYISLVTADPELILEFKNRLEELGADGPPAKNDYRDVAL